MKRNSLAGGITLILLGVFFIVWQIAPDSYKAWFDQFMSWPFYIIGAGLVFLLFAIATGDGGLAIPGSIIAGVGGILFYQSQSGDWVSWAYIWTAIPGLVGLGMFIGGLVDRDMRGERRTGLHMFVISAIITLLLFAAFHSGMFASSFIWAAALILLGLYMLISAFLRRR
jgi:hypothetical protein